MFEIHLLGMEHPTQLVSMSIFSVPTKKSFLPKFVFRSFLNLFSKPSQRKKIFDSGFSEDFE